MDKQRTILKEASVKGVGLHTAKKVNVTFKPAPPDSGINFVRTDFPSAQAISASIDSLLSAAHFARRTCIGNDGPQVQTIEHLMAALSGLGIDNLLIELDNDEVPGLDGSSADFIKILRQAGIVEQEKERRVFILKEPVFAQEDGASIIALPSKEFTVSYTLNYNHPLLSAQFLQLKVTPEIFEKELAPARTFCLEEEASHLKNQGLGQGANYENTLVVGKAGVINNKLRYEDEFVRHKVSDLLGDLYLLAQPVIAHIIALKSGHSLNLKLVKKIDEQRKRYLSAGISSGYNPKAIETQLDIDTIMKILPHRQPFLFVDRITHLEKGKCATGIKNVTINDYFFKGHFPGKPVMPGVLIIEAMAQVGGVMMLAPEENRGKLAYFLSADNIKFRKTVLPGDQLVMEVVAGRIKAKTGQVHARAFVDGKVVTEADLMFALV